MLEKNTFLYQKIYQTLVDGIQTGKYKDGDRIPTEKEIALQYGVSRITSRKALEMLNDNGYIERSPGRGSFVKHNRNVPLTEDLNLNSGEVKRFIGLVMPDFGTSFGMDLMLGIEKAAAENHYYILLERTYSDQTREIKAIENLIQTGVDGIILMPVHGEHYNPLVFKLVLEGFPCVVIDRYLKGIPVPFVGTNNIDAAANLTQYLIDHDHRAIGFISPPAISTSTIEDRIDGFIQCHNRNKLPVHKELWMTEVMSSVPGQNSIENIHHDIERMKRLILDNPQMTAIFAVEYNLALMVEKAAYELNKKIPDELCIVCFDGPSNYLGDYYFTHIRQREMEIGIHTVKRMLSAIEKRELPERIYIDYDFVLSTRTHIT